MRTLEEIEKDIEAAKSAHASMTRTRAKAANDPNIEKEGCDIFLDNCNEELAKLALEKKDAEEEASRRGEG